MDGFKTTTGFNFHKDQKDEEERKKSKNMGITKVNFKFDHKKRPSSLFSKKPKLDDIMAEYRKMDKTARITSTRSTSFHPKKKKTV